MFHVFLFHFLSQMISIKKILLNKTHEIVPNIFYKTPHFKTINAYLIYNLIYTSGKKLLFFEKFWYFYIL